MKKSSITKRVITNEIAPTEKEEALLAILRKAAQEYRKTWAEVLQAEENLYLIQEKCNALLEKMPDSFRDKFCLWPDESQTALVLSEMFPEPASERDTEVKEEVRDIYIFPAITSLQ